MIQERILQNFSSFRILAQLRQELKSYTTHHILNDSRADFTELFYIFLNNQSLTLLYVEM